MYGITVFPSYRIVKKGRYLQYKKEYRQSKFKIASPYFQNTVYHNTRSTVRIPCNFETKVYRNSETTLQYRISETSVYRILKQQYTDIFRYYRYRFFLRYRNCLYRWKPQAGVARSIDLVRDLKETDFAAEPRDAEVFMSYACIMYCILVQSSIFA